MQYSSLTVRRALEDLQALGVLLVEKSGPGVADKWHSRKKWTEMLANMTQIEAAFIARQQATYPDMVARG